MKMPYFFVLLLLGGGVSAVAPTDSPASDISPAPALTPREKDWLRAHPKIRLAFDNSLPPYSFIDKKAQFSGIAVDIMHALSKKLGIAFEVYPKTSGDTIYSALSEQRMDVIASMVDRPEHREWFNFTHPYLTKSLVIMTHKTDTAINGRNDLAGKTVAFVGGLELFDQIAAKNPALKSHPVPSMLACLQAVERKKADVCITFSGTAQYLQRKHHLDNLQFAGFYERNTADESIAVRKDWPLLAEILQKGLDSLSESEMNAIYLKWMPPGKPMEELNAASSGRFGSTAIKWGQNLSLDALFRFLMPPLLAVVGFFSYRKLKHYRNTRATADRSEEGPGQSFKQLQSDFERMILKRTADLNNSERKYRNLVENLTKDYFFYQRDRQGNMTYVSPSVAFVLGYEPDTFGLHFRKYLSNNPANRRIETILESCIQGLPTPPYQLEFFDSGNRRRWLEIADAPVYDDYGNCIGVDGLAFDITERKLEEEKLIWLSFHDDLTGLANRRLFTDRVQQAIPLSNRTCMPFAVLYLHVERFRLLVDEMGHAAGDYALKHIAKKLVATVRESDTAACLGDGEFALLLPDTDINASASVAQKIIRNLREPLTFGMKSVKLDVTLGISLYPRHGSSPDTLLEYADASMHYARKKRLGYSSFTEA
jgi:diguanylate cyclase (GGDEF)-like protein/PAS domain S-box-containing protein